MPSVIILPESDDTTLCLNLKGQVTVDDFDTYFHAEIKKRVLKNGYFKMVVNYDKDFKGWDIEAARKDLQSIFELGAKPRKLAYVNPPKRKIMLMKMVSAILGGEIRYFEPGQYAQALEWVKR